jgi:hypothetical protein
MEELAAGALSNLLQHLRGNQLPCPFDATHGSCRVGAARRWSNGYLKPAFEKPRSQPVLLLPPFKLRANDTHAARNH